ncbi:sulfotransferase [uncultured Jannaschia sp.]|uniref:sulfotransferase family protein n=1 Tax=uncultured Jannaschia sp. TaxID=293347 RepID=UPI002630D885|nr:sulfotransferase [uncultured Jannaschia sp.]
MARPTRYLFIGGLHRSGTSLVARMAARVPGATGIEGAPVPENEGVYLQGAIAHDALAGAPMRFATDPAQHLTEAHPLNRLETRVRLAADWDPWFPEGAAWRVEKSPVNLTRMRLLQQLFPLSQFVVVIRHPEAVAAAVAKWVDDPAPALIDHWLDAHDIVAADIDRLHAILVLRYEDVVARPDAIRAALGAFLDRGTAVPPRAEATRDGNRDYPDAPVMTDGQALRASAWGYAPGRGVAAWPPILRHPLRSVRDATTAALGGQSSK